MNIVGKCKVLHNCYKYILPAMWFEDSDLFAHSSSSDEDGQRYLENRSRWVSWGQEYDDKLVSAQQYLSIKMTLFLSTL